MMQPLSGESSVLGICLISGKCLLSILNKSSGAVEQIKPRITRPRRDARFKSIGSFFSSAYRLLDEMFAIIRAQADGFALQVVPRANETDGFAFRAHQDGVSHRDGRDCRFHASQ